MAGLDTKYIPLNILQQYFVDKQTGFPLAGGKVYFYRDSERTVLKPVYQISGTPPDYTYTVLTNPLVLSSHGTFVDENGSDISVYAFPYDDDDNIDLYYVYVTDFSGSFQWDREGVPNIGLDFQSQDTSIFNYVTNPQFLSHTNIGTDNKVVDALTAIATGGWYYRRPESSTSSDYVLFDYFGSVTTNPPGNPKFAVRIRTESSGSGDAYKVLSLRFDDVNTFSSDIQQYTFAFWGASNAGSNLIVSLRLVKNFGTGGSPEDITTIDSNITINNFYEMFSNTFIFGSNQGKVIGTGSYVALEIWLPTTYVFDVSFTDFILTMGSINITQFPVTPTSSVMYRSVAGYLPIQNPDGSDLGLPLISTKEGLAYDRSGIGKIYASASGKVKFGELICNASKYSTTGISSDGIPYSRLQKELWDEVFYVPIYGTGLDYFTVCGKGFSPTLMANGSFLIANNSAGAVTATSDGSVATGFTFETVHVGNSGYYVKSYKTTLDSFAIECLELGEATTTAGTSGFTIDQYLFGHRGGFLQQSTNVKYVTESHNIDRVITVSATNLAGKYFEVWVPHSGVAQKYYVWFKVDGVGTNPNIAGSIGILVQLRVTDDASIVAEKIRLSINGFNVTYITPVAASLISPGAFFNVYSTDEHYYFWFTIDGVGSDPNVSGATGIKIELIGTDDVSTVRDKIQKGGNSLYFAVPESRGVFLRGTGGSETGLDPDALTRFSMVSGLIGDRIGTNQLDQNLDHIHVIKIRASPYYQRGSSDPYYVGSDYLSANSLAEGGAQSNPYNLAVLLVIKY